MRVAGALLLVHGLFSIIFDDLFGCGAFTGPCWITRDGQPLADALAGSNCGVGLVVPSG